MRNSALDVDCGGRRRWILPAAGELRGRLPVHYTVSVNSNRMQPRPVRSLRPIAHLSLALLAGLLCAATTHDSGQTAQTAATTPTSSPAESVADVIARLGDESYAVREQASGALLKRGPAVETELRTAMERASDPEVRRRLADILDNIVPPQRAALLLRVEPDSGLRAGELITHISGRRIRGKSDVLQRLRQEVAPLGAIVRVLGEDGPRDVGPVFLKQIREMADFVEPRGSVIAAALREYRDGNPERAYERLGSVRESAPEAELPGTLMARVAYTAGHGEEALGLLRRYLDPSSLGGCATGDWTTLSTLDEAGPQRAPYCLEWALCEEGHPNYERNSDPDLRVQRILVPARRFVDAHLKAAEIWWHRHDTAEERLSGNLLAVCGWMLYELELRSECCRLIEPRSALLRRSSGGAHKWVRVDTDSWLPFFAGDAAGALDAFYDDAMEVLNHPPRRDDPNSLVRNPDVAARVAFFLYQVPEDKRIDETLRIMSDPPHPVLDEYLRWMLRAVHSGNAGLIRRHLAAALPILPDALSGEFARYVALLEYVQSEPDATVLAVARQRLFQSPPAPRREAWLAQIDVMAALLAGKPSEAVAAAAPLADDPDSAALISTAKFLAAPPPHAAEQSALRSPILAVPLGSGGTKWIVLARDRRLMEFDSAGGQLRALDTPSPHWYPGPLTWPWLGREAASGRAWAYELRRVRELAPEGTGLTLNIRTEEIEPFQRFAAPYFSRLAEAAGANVRQVGEDGEFLRSEVTANLDYTTDPKLPEIAVIESLEADPRVVHIALRGGPQLLIDQTHGKAWSSEWIQEKAGLPRPPSFTARALWPASPPDPPVLLLLSEQGLLRFDAGGETVARLAIPGTDPNPPVVAEDTPYDRRDPRYFYFSGLSDAPTSDPRGPMYRLRVADGEIETLDTQNLSLPESYYRLLPRSVLRAQLSARMKNLALPDLSGFLGEVQKATSTQPQAEGDRQ